MAQAATLKILRRPSADPDLFAVLRFGMLNATNVAVDTVEFLRVPGMSQLIPMRSSEMMRNMRGLHSKTWCEEDTMFDFLPIANPNTSTTLPSPPDGYKFGWVIRVIMITLIGRCVLGHHP